MTKFQQYPAFPKKSSAKTKANQGAVLLFSPFHVLNLLPHAKEEVATCIEQGNNRVHSFGFVVKFVMPFDQRKMAR